MHQLKELKIDYFYHNKHLTDNVRFIDQIMAKYKPFSVYRAKYMKNIGREEYKRTMLTKETKFKLITYYPTEWQAMYDHPRIYCIEKWSKSNNYL